MKHTLESARLALASFIADGTLSPGGSFNTYDCDGIRVAVFKVDGGLKDEYGHRWAGVKRQLPGQSGTVSRRHLPHYTR